MLDWFVGLPWYGKLAACWMALAVVALCYFWWAAFHAPLGPDEE